MAKKPINTQMEMFELGGLKDQGDTTDPISKNQVPIGSTQKEVRDDIPAQLSEGEFVLPADVVRYHGLEKLMKLRQQAKGGLKTMEQMGQMGNSDQAIMSDDLPFKPQFQEGGMVQAPIIQAPQVLQPSNVPGYQRPQTQGVQFTPAQGQQQIQSSFATPQQTVSIPFAQQYRTPTYTPPSYQEPISFRDYIGAEFGQLQKTETRRYTNEQGEELYIPFVNGKPIYPIPAGYTEYKEEAKPPTDDRPTTPTTRVRDESDGGDDSSPGVKTTRVSEIASNTAGGKKSVTDFFSTGKGKSIAGSVLGTAMLGPIGGIIGGLLGKALADDKQQLAQQMGAIPGTTGPLGPERNFDQLSQQAYGKGLTDVTSMLGGVTPTFSYGYNPGSVDVATGGTFNAAGIAVDENGNMSTSNGVPSYDSFASFANAMAVSAETGYYGGPVSKDEYNNMSPKGKDLYNSYASGLGIPSYEITDPDVEDISDDVPSPSPTDPSGMDFGVTDPSLDINADVEDISPDVETPSTTQSQPDPIDSTGDPYGGGEGSGVSTGDPSGGGGGSDIGDPSQGNASNMGMDDDTSAQSEGPGGSDTAGDSSADGSESTGKIICTAMNKMYGLPMYSNRVWMRYNKYKKLDSAWELGYHKIFLSLVKKMPTNKYIRKSLEWFANTRTYGLKEEMKGNMFTVNTLILRPLFSPIVYITGKLVQKGILKRADVKSI